MAFFGKSVMVHRFCCFSIVAGKPNGMLTDFDNLTFKHMTALRKKHGGLSAEIRVGVCHPQFQNVTVS